MRLFLALVLSCIASIASDQPARSEGAFAFSQNYDGGWASSLGSNYATSREAIDSVLADCYQRGSNCQIHATFRQSCFAFATSQYGNGMGYGEGATEKEARQNAMRGCRQRNGSCKHGASRCDAVREVIKETICIRPVFAEVFRLRNEAGAGTMRVDDAAAAIEYLNDAYCREVEGPLGTNEETHLSETCFQYRTSYHGESVFWMRCHE